MSIVLLFQYLLVTFNFSPIASQNFDMRPVTEMFVSLAPQRRHHISNEFYQIRFVRCNNTRLLCKLQPVSGQSVGSKQTYFVGRNSRELLADNMPVGSVSMYPLARTVMWLISLSGVCPGCCVLSVLAPVQPRPKATQSRTGATIVAVEKQCLLHILIVCLQPLVSSMQFACAVLSSVACPALQYFSTLSHKRHDF